MARMLIAAALAAVLLPASARAQGAPPPPPVSVARPIVRDVVEWTDFIGRFEAVDAVEIRARVDGFLATVHFQDGALVKAGDLLFTIDQRPYRAALQEAEASLAAMVARRDYAQGDLGRADTLKRGGNIAEQTVDQRRQNLLTSRADVRRAEAALARARLDMEFTEIRAPFAGRMSRRLVSAGSLVQVNDTLLASIVSVDPIQFYFDADERSYLAFLRAGTAGLGEVEVSLADETGTARHGRIDFIDNRIDQASGTMRGRAVFANSDLSLVPGLFGRLRFPATRIAGAVLVPDEAIAADQDRRIVYVVDGDGRATARQVKPGPRADGYRVVREGLTGAETIVVNGLSRVQPGASVQPRLTELPARRQQAARP